MKKRKKEKKEKKKKKHITKATNDLCPGTWISSNGLLDAPSNG